MSSKAKLIKEIETFLRQNKMSPTAFGARFMNDKAFVGRLRERAVRTDTIDRLRRDMKDFKARKPRPKPTTHAAA